MDTRNNTSSNDITNTITTSFARAISVDFIPNFLRWLPTNLYFLNIILLRNKSSSQIKPLHGLIHGIGNSTRSEEGSRLEHLLLSNTSNIPRQIYEESTMMNAKISHPRRGGIQLHPRVKIIMAYQNGISN